MLNRLRGCGVKKADHPSEVVVTLSHFTRASNAGLCALRPKGGISSLTSTLTCRVLRSLIQMKPINNRVGEQNCGSLRPVGESCVWWRSGYE